MNILSYALDECDDNECDSWSTTANFDSFETQLDLHQEASVDELQQPPGMSSTTMNLSSLPPHTEPIRLEVVNHEISRNSLNMDYQQQICINDEGRPCLDASTTASASGDSSMDESNGKFDKQFTKST
jgi:hypothetical protein